MEDATARTRPVDVSTLGLIGGALSRTTGLFRGEPYLARAEVQENLKKTVVASGMIVAALVFFLVALNVLAAAPIGGISELGIAAGWESLIAGGAFLIIGIIMALAGKTNLEAVRLAPTRTAQNVQRDTQALKGATIHGR